MKIAIVGAGWYGCHLAITLKRLGHDVTLIEKADNIMSGISGELSIRLHAGPHYPRSAKTREHCRSGLERFKAYYPELVVPTDSVYGLGEMDASGNPPKIDTKAFHQVCHESPSSRSIDLSQSDYQHLLSAEQVDEPSVTIGDRLRAIFRKYLEKTEVKLKLQCEVSHLKSTSAKVKVTHSKGVESFDKVINVTNYQSLIPKDLPFAGMQMMYQPSLALIYEDTEAGNRPVSFIVVDGEFPCLMPRVYNMEQEEQAFDFYSLTHGKWTIMGTYSSPEEAQSVLAKINDDFVKANIQPAVEEEMNRFWPHFGDDKRFQYRSWKGQVAAKLKTLKEFRSAVTFEKDNIIYVIPGKITNIFDVADEVTELLAEKKCLEKEGYHYVEGGILHSSLDEILEKPAPNEPNTSTIQTYNEICQRHAKPSVKLKASEAKNSSFTLQYLLQLGLALSGIALLIALLPYIGVGLFAIGSGLAVLGLSYSTYRFFTHGNKVSSAPLYEPNMPHPCANN